MINYNNAFFSLISPFDTAPFMRLSSNQSNFFCFTIIRSRFLYGLLLTNGSKGLTIKPLS
jgi:hypothetical protein